MKKISECLIEDIVSINSSLTELCKHEINTWTGVTAEEKYEALSNLNFSSSKWDGNLEATVYNVKTNYKDQSGENVDANIKILVSTIH